jgi:hypothetical protein
MPIFYVMCFDGGIWDERDVERIIARNAQQAAERVCGEPLAECNIPGQLRAQATAVARPNKKTMFRRA